MTRDEIIKMARAHGVAMQEKNADVAYLFTLEGVEKLLAAEREACAKVCEVLTPTDANGVCPVADAIRARGNNE